LILRLRQIVIRTLCRCEHSAGAEEIADAGADADAILSLADADADADADTRCRLGADA
jgi:hypothetical protein